MVTVPQYETQLQLRRKKLEQTQKQVTEFKPTPSLTQQQLRRTTSPMEQLARIKELESKRRLAKQEAIKKVGVEFEKQKRLEKEFVPIKAEYGKYQQALAEKKALGLAQRLYEHGVSVRGVKGLPQKYLKQLYERGQVEVRAKEKFKTDIQQFQKDYPSEKLTVDWKKLEVKGVESKALGKTLSYPDYLKALEKQRETPKVTFKEIPATKIKPDLTEVKVIPEEPKGFIERVKTKGLIPALTPAYKKVVSGGEVALKKITKGVGLVTSVPVLTPPVAKAVSLVTGKEVPTIGETVELGRKGLTKLGEITGKGYERLLKEREYELAKEVPEITTPLYLRETIGPEGKPLTKITVPKHIEVTPVGMIPKVFGAAPELGAWIASPEAMLTSNIIVGAEKQKRLKQDYQKELKKQYQLALEVEPPEGYRNPTLVEFETKQGSEIRRSLEKQYLKEVGISLAVLGGLEGWRAVSYLKKPVIETRIRKPVSKFVEVKKPIITPKGETAISRYKIYTYKPPVEMQLTRRYRELLGMKPKIPWTPITKSQLYVTEPLAGLPVMGQQPYIARVAKYGKAGKLGIPKHFAIGPEGKVKLIPYEEIAKLKGISKYQLSELIKQTRLGGRFPKEVSKYIKGSEQVSLGRLKTYDPTKPLGKQFTKQQIISITKLEKTYPTGEKLFGVEVGYKPVTKISPRATGKIPVMKGKVLELTPLHLGTKEAVKFVRAAGIKKTPLSFTFGGPKQIQAAETLKLIPVEKPLVVVPKPRIPELITKATEKLAQKEIGVPLMVGGMGLKELPAAKAALYEEQFIKITPKITEKQAPVVIQEEVFKLEQKPILRPRLVQTPVQRPVQKPGEIQKPIVEVPVITVPVLKLEPVSKVTPYRVIGRSTERVIDPTKVKVIPLKLPGAKAEMLRRRKAREKVGYIPYVRRYGEYKPVTKPTTLKRAKFIGVRRLKRTLAASLKIKKLKTGEWVPIAKETLMFRPAKKGKDIFTLVEKAPFRLKTREEVREIISARRGALIRKRFPKKIRGAKFLK